MKLKNKSTRSVLIFTYFIIFILILGCTFTISYFSFSRHIEETNEELMVETANQITYNYENYIASILQTSDSIQENIQADNSVTKEDTSKYFDVLMSTKKEILSIQLYDDENGNLITSDSTSYPPLIVKNCPWFLNAKNDPTIHFLSPIIDKGDTYKIRFAKVIPIDHINKKAVLSMEIDFSQMINLNYKTSLGEGGHLLIIDDKYQIIYSSQKQTNIDELKLLDDMVVGTSRYSSDNHEYSVTLNTITNSRWRLAIFYNIDSMGVILGHFILTLSLVLVAIFLVGMGIIFLVTKQITKPIKSLEETMSHIDETGPKILSNIDNGTKEIFSLSQTYNQMIEQINALMEQVVIEQTNQRKSELKALQYQINPHFLYNTLDSIVWLIDNDKKDEAQSMVIALAKLFRISISRGNNIIPVRNEIEHVKNYLFIQSMRYTDSFEYHIEVDEECYKYQVMKLILQPLVENSIYHGLKNKIDKGIIRITGHMEGQNLILTIEDNGYGIKEEKIKELYKRFDDPDLNDGVGLKNVYQRLRLYYGESSYLKIESEIDEGTKIIISIPVEEIKNED